MTDNLQPPSGVYAAIAAITADLAKAGIAKDRKATGGASYNFRGIDDVYNALAPLLAEHKLCILPQVLEREVIERQSRSGGALFYVTVKVKFDFVSAEDGSCHEVITLGEAMDSGDKATNKAMSAAYKYAAMMAFCIPTLGVDGEEDTHEVTGRKPRSDRGKPHRGTDRYAAGERLKAVANDEASRGSDALGVFWNSLIVDDKRAIADAFGTNVAGCLALLKERASVADEDIRQEEQPT